MQATSKGGIYFFAGLSVATGYLGVWQSQRYGWKNDLIADNTEKYQLPVEEIKTLGPDIMKKYQGRKIKFDGYYDHSREVLLGPRSAPTRENKAQGMATNPQGYYVITPLMLKCGDGATIFVNRGWVMRDAQNNTAVSFSRPNWASVTGVVQKPEEQNLFSPENSPASGKLLWLSSRDLVLASKSRLGASTQFDDGSPQVTDADQQDGGAFVEPVVVEEIVDSDDKDVKVQYPIPRDAKYADTSYVTPETHLAYAFTWFALSRVWGCSLHRLHEFQEEENPPPRAGPKTGKAVVLCAMC